METNIELVFEENEGGGHMLEFTRIENLRKALVVVDGYVTTEIALKENAVTYTAHFHQDALKFKSRSRSRKGIDFKQYTLRAYIPVDTAERRVNFEVMQNNRYLVIYHAMNGKRYVLGDKGEGCKFEYNVDHGNSSRMNKTDIGFTYSKFGVLPELEASVGQAVEPKNDTDFENEDEPFGRPGV